MFNLTTHIAKSAFLLSISTVLQTHLAWPFYEMDIAAAGVFDACCRGVCRCSLCVSTSPDIPRPCERSSSLLYPASVRDLLSGGGDEPTREDQEAEEKQKTGVLTRTHTMWVRCHSEPTLSAKAL